ncbi:MAG: RHS repeat-associated core domain-containing protein, partial [Spiribacter salinus]
SKPAGSTLIHLFSIAAITDDTGAVVERYGYDAYGDSVVLDAAGDPLVENVSTVGNPYRFTGRRVDDETGLQFNRVRYFSNEAGRFLSRDPYGYIDGLSLYRGYYVPNYRDPFGLYSCEDICAEIGRTKGGIEVLKKIREQEEYTELGEIDDALEEYGGEIAGTAGVGAHDEGREILDDWETSVWPTTVGLVSVIGHTGAGAYEGNALRGWANHELARSGLFLMYLDRLARENDCDCSGEESGGDDMPDPPGDGVVDIRTLDNCPHDSFETYGDFLEWMEQQQSQGQSGSGE